MSVEQNKRGGGHRSTRGEPLFEPRETTEAFVSLRETVLRAEQVPHRSGTRKGGFRALGEVFPRRLATCAPTAINVGQCRGTVHASDGLPALCRSRRASQI